MSVTPCRLAGVNHALVTIASSHFSTVSFGYDTSCGTAASEAPDYAEIGSEFQNCSSRVRRPVALSLETTDNLIS